MVFHLHSKPVLLLLFFPQTKTQILTQTSYVPLYDYYINPQENKFSIQILSEISYTLD